VLGLERGWVGRVRAVGEFVLLATSRPGVVRLPKFSSPLNRARPAHDPLIDFIFHKATVF
jgi:hypothetical protein